MPTDIGLVRRVIGLLLACILPVLLPPAAAATTIGVVYPEVSGPYARVFENIIAGIDSAEGVKVVSLGLEEGASARDVGNWLSREGVESVIALGQRGYAVARELSQQLPIVVGAALVAPDGVTGISLAADPEQFLQRLGVLTPPVKRVFVVYNDRNSGWLVRRAERLAPKYGVKLVAYEAGDMRSAVKSYVEMLAEARDDQDAIWLPLDAVAPDKAILPLVLEEAWKKHLVVFSNNPSHVEKGVLFSLFPDDKNMGRRLAEMAVALVKGAERNIGVVPLRDLKLAVNLRTASHLGMFYTPLQEQSFSLVFPTR